MAIGIESLLVENLRHFRDSHQLDLSQNNETNMDVITGRNGAGKTTLADSIHLCLTGEFSNDAPLVTLELVDQLSLGEQASARVSVVMLDSELGRRFQFSRQFQTTQTRRGPINSVDSLRVQEHKGGEYVDVGSGRAIHTVFPLSAFTFCKLHAESLFGFENARNGISWSELVEDLGDAAAQQAATRDVVLSEYFANDNDLGDEMLRRINDRLESIDGRYRVEERQDGLVGRAADMESDRVIRSLPAGEETLISQVAALVAGELMPATPPLIGDSLLARVDEISRRQIFQMVKESNRQALLFAVKPEIDRLDITPRLRIGPD